MHGVPGLTDDEIWDVGAITALFALSNRMAHLTGSAPQFRVLPARPHAALSGSAPDQHEPVHRGPGLAVAHGQRVGARGEAEARVGVGVVRPRPEDWVSFHSAVEPESTRTVNASADELGAFTQPAIV